MKYVTMAVATLLLSVSAAAAETEIDRAVSDMVAEDFLPRQEELAGHVQDALVARLQDDRASQVLSGLSPKTRRHLYGVSLNDGHRDISVVTAWHENAYQTVHFPESECQGEICTPKQFYPVIQWRRDDGGWEARRLHNFQSVNGIPRVEGLNAKIIAVHDLPADDLYLIQGAWPSNRRPAYVGFLVVGFEDDALVLDYPAFDGVSPIIEATLYDDTEPLAFMDHFHYNSETQEIVFEDLQKREMGRDLVTVPRDPSRMSSRILNPDGQDVLRLRYLNGAFHPTE